ncbi:hypothetical protein DFH07DRAFT_501415 [Mycena maculata]|uniref:Nephrocystin 3-like N-terminal domain-containing protein n=1 Tax=Mycena maculata TaxID=230809 RepID=A0AAD7NBX0_9AGAR|nr:hypothetical protein DFH07DRAFT_501415 [Mycena maculata]
MSGFLKRGRSKLKSGLLQVTHVATSVASSRSPSPHVPGASHSQGSHTPQRSASKQTRSQRTAELGRTAYDGLNLIVQSLYDCSDIFLPLKTAAGVFLAITGVVERVSANKKELDELELRLKSILSIVQTYKGLGGMRELQSRIEKFCEDIENQMKSVENMKNHPVLVRSAESTTDADKIAKAFRNMNILCEMFQMDTQANITVNVAEIIRLLKTGSLDRLNYKTSYKTRQSPYGDPTSCMPGTRVQILDDLVTWASHEGPKVYWMVGMAGTGKSTIAQTFCERLDEKNMLGASFFCSRASDNANDARLIIPAIAHSLASTSPAIKSQVIKAIEDEPALAEPTYIKMDVQFNELIAQPIRITVGAADKRYKVIVIDAVDECRDLRRVASLIRLFLASVSQIPLRIFIASRDEYLIRQAFNTYTAEEFHLHEVDKNVVKDDIAMYVKALLHQVHEDNGNDSGETWPPESELSALLHQSSTLFIYAATAIRYILDGEALYKSRLTALTQETKSGGKQMLGIDGLYALILEQACHDWEEHEIKRMRDVMSLVIFFRTPLSIEAISSLSRLDASQYLSRLTSVIHVPSRKQSSITVTPLHTSFPEFVTDYTRCSPACCPTFTVLVAAECHELLAVKCLELMNRLLEYNVAKVPEELTMPRGERKNSPQYIDSIPEVLKYSCIHWVSHLMEVQMPCTELITALLTFFRTHLLQWIECMTVLCKSLMVPKSLTGVATTLTVCFCCL